MMKQITSVWLAGEHSPFNGLAVVPFLYLKLQLKLAGDGGEWTSPAKPHDRSSESISAGLNVLAGALPRTAPTDFGSL